MKKNCCIVVASYYPDISKNLLIGATKVLRSNGIKKFKIIKVPGVYEIPVVIAKNIKKFNGFISLGCVIKGKTPHFNFISKSTINALMSLSITHKKPIGNGIITCLNKHQALIRSDSSKKNKGGEAARAMLSILKN